MPEKTRHFVATVYLINDNAVALHNHKKYSVWLPPGGHIESKELPHEAARRETIEETGITPQFLSEQEYDGERIANVPEPQLVQVQNVDISDGNIYHQHVDNIFFAHSPTRNIKPEQGEAQEEEWEWFSYQELSNDNRIEKTVAEISQRAINSIQS